MIYFLSSNVLERTEWTEWTELGRKMSKLKKPTLLTFLSSVAPCFSEAELNLASDAFILQIILKHCVYLGTQWSHIPSPWVAYGLEEETNTLRVVSAVTISPLPGLTSDFSHGWVDSTRQGGSHCKPTP